MSDNASALFERLVELTKPWNAHDLVQTSHQVECREIGTKLFALGGEQLMQQAYYHVTGHNRAAHVIAAYWEGIGEWRW